MLKQGAWPMGTRLETARLADELGISATPVRDCLNRLVGERLVEQWPGEGFRVPRLSESNLRDLFDFNHQILGLAAARTDRHAAQAPVVGAGDAYADVLGRAFALIARCARNQVMTETVEALNDRLHPVRRLYPILDPRAQEKLDGLRHALDEELPRKALSTWLLRHHRDCRRRVPDLLRLLHDPQTPD